MVEFKVVINDARPEAKGKSYATNVGGHNANALLGKQIGDEVDGIFVNLPAYRLVITGGSDTTGVPLRKDVQGPGRKRILTSYSTGFKPTVRGLRRRKPIRGNTVSSDVIQINMKITHHGAKSIEELLS